MSTVEAPKLNFQSFLPNSRGVAYVCPNEDLGIWRDLVKGKRIRRAAGICSGGEVGFFALLPTVREELVLIDHNLGSLYYASVKYLLLRQYGYAGLMRLFRHTRELEKALAEVEKHLPPQLQGVRDDMEYNASASTRLLKAAQDFDNYTGGQGTKLLQQWERPQRHQRRAVDTKLDKVTFVHGDLDALDNQGKFDLLYMSNAHESGNGNVGVKDLERIGKCLNPGGYVLSSTTIKESKQPKVIRTWSWTQQAYVTQVNPRYRELPEGWTLVQSIPRRDVGMTRWNYCLYQVAA